MGGGAKAGATKKTGAKATRHKISVTVPTGAAKKGLK
jgi:hypothetical protein